MTECPQRDAGRHRMSERRLDTRRRNVGRCDENEADDGQQRGRVPPPVGGAHTITGFARAAPYPQTTSTKRDEGDEPSRQLPATRARCARPGSPANPARRCRRNAQREISRRPAIISAMDASRVSVCNGGILIWCPSRQLRCVRNRAGAVNAFCAIAARRGNRYCGSAAH